MCEMCECDREYYGEPIPGWHLGRARKDGDVLKAGEWFLVTMNSPSFWWYVKPIPDNDSMEQAVTFDQFCEEIQIRSIDEAWELMEAARLSGGYIREEGGSFQFWLFNFLGRFLEKNPNPQD